MQRLVVARLHHRNLSLIPHRKLGDSLRMTAVILSQLGVGEDPTAKSWTSSSRCSPRISGVPGAAISPTIPFP
jgi:hypothetical protein